MMTNQVDIDERLWELWKEAQKQAKPKDAYASALEAELLALHPVLQGLVQAGEAVAKDVRVVADALKEDHERSGCDKGECWMKDSVELLYRAQLHLEHTALAALRPDSGAEGSERVTDA